MAVLMQRFGLGGLSPEDRLELVEELLASELRIFGALFD